MKAEIWRLRSETHLQLVSVDEELNSQNSHFGTIVVYATGFLKRQLTQIRKRLFQAVKITEVKTIKGFLLDSKRGWEVGGGWVG